MGAIEPSQLPSPRLVASFSSLFSHCSTSQERRSSASERSHELVRHLSRSPLGLRNHEDCRHDPFVYPSIISTALGSFINRLRTHPHRWEEIRCVEARRTT